MSRTNRIGCDTITRKAQTSSLLIAGSEQAALIDFRPERKNEMSKTRKERTAPRTGERRRRRLSAAALKFFRECGEKGGATTKKRHGTKYFKKIGKLGGRPSKEEMAKAA
jgi:hypothetical protein